MKGNPHCEIDTFYRIIYNESFDNLCISQF